MYNITYSHYLKQPAHSVLLFVYMHKK